MGVRLKVNGNIIKTFMVENGLNLKELSERTEVSTPTIGRALRGGYLSPKTINKLLSHMGNLEVKDLVILEEDKIDG